MCTIRDMIGFARNGFAVFSQAAKGQYANRSQEMSLLRQEVFVQSLGLRGDLKNIAGDLHVAYQKVVNNG